MRPLFSFCLSILVCLGIIWSPDMAQADCMSNGIYFSPKTNTDNAPRNVRPFIAIMGGTKTFATDLRAMTLSSKGHQVKFKVVAHNLGLRSMGMRYFSLVPQETLKPNRRYQLHFKLGLKVGKGATAYMRRHFWSKLKAYRFTTGKQSDTKPPTAPAKVATPGYKVKFYGCGPARRIPFTIGKVSDNATPVKGLRYLVEATIVSKVKTLRLSIVTGIDWRPSKTFIGHNMCSGNIAQLPKGTYTLRVRAIDYAGNLSAPSQPVTATVS